MNESKQRSRKEMHSDHYVQRFSDERQMARVAQLVDRLDLPPSSNVLDVGCGTGILAEVLSPGYGNYTGVDFSDAMVRAANARANTRGLRHCEFICGDAIDVMQGASGTYDAIFMLDISEHVPDREWADIVNAARQALKPGGRVYLHTPNLEFIVERMKQWGLMRQFHEHIAVRNAAGNMQFFRAGGYQSVSCEVVPHYNVLRMLHALSAIPVIGRYFAARLWIVAIK